MNLQYFRVFEEYGDGPDSIFLGWRVFKDGERLVESTVLSYAIMEALEMYPYANITPGNGWVYLDEIKI